MISSPLALTVLVVFRTTLLPFLVWSIIVTVFITSSHYSLIFMACVFIHGLCKGDITGWGGALGMRVGVLTIVIGGLSRMSSWHCGRVCELKKNWQSCGVVLFSHSEDTGGSARAAG